MLLHVLILKNENRKLRLWELSQSQYPLIETFLDKSFNLESEDFVDKLAEAVTSIINDNLMEYLEQYLDNNKENEDVYRNTDKLWNLAVNSAVYIVFKRCGLLPVPSKYQKCDIEVLHDISHFQELSSFGVMLTESTSNLLAEIEKNVKKDIAKQLQQDYNSIKENVMRGRNTNEDNIQTGRGLSDSKSDITGSAGRSGWEIRTNAKEILNGEQEKRVFDNVDKWDFKTASSGYRQGRMGNERDISEADAGKRSWSGQDGRSNGMGSTSEYDNTPGGRGDSTGAGIQLSLFPTEEEQKLIIEKNEGAENFAPFSVEKKKELIEYIINTNYSKINGKSRIASAIATYQIDEKIKAVALDNMRGGKGISYNNEKYSLWTDESGIKYAKGDNARFNTASQLITWPEIIDAIKKGLMYNKMQYSSPLLHVVSSAGTIRIAVLISGNS